MDPKLIVFINITASIWRFFLFFFFFVSVVDGLALLAMRLAMSLSETHSDILGSGLDQTAAAHNKYRCSVHFIISFVPQPIFKSLYVWTGLWKKTTKWLSSIHTGTMLSTRHDLLTWVVKTRHLDYIHTLTCLMAVTVMTKNRGSPLVIGEVGVSIINCKGERASG